MGAALNLIPFLRWAGGKRWLIKESKDFLPTEIAGTYYEPFLGGGSVYSVLQPCSAVLSDINTELINTYIQIRDNCVLISKGLMELKNKHCAVIYNTIREKVPEDPIERAIRFIYLNRTCFNGIYRVNHLGQFNVPIGSRSSIILPTDDFCAWSVALKKATLKVVDFEIVINQAKTGDFIFADPPYTILHNNNCFRKYNEVLFSWDDQKRLAKALIRAKNRGVQILSTNANHVSVSDLYKEDFNISVASRRSSISAKSSNRGSYQEIIIKTYPSK